MDLRSTVVNVLWGGSSALSWERSCHALRAPADGEGAGVAVVPAPE